MAEQDGAKKIKDIKSNLRKRDGELSDYVFGKVQPQAVDLESAVLGALMLDKDALPIVLDILRPESFYTDAHQLIYQAILRLFEKSHPVDLLTVTEELKKSGDIDTVGGAYYLVELTGRVGSSANIEFHARIVTQKHIQRELIKVSTQIIRDAYEDTTDVFTLLDEAEQGLFAVTQNNLSRQYESMGELASKTLKILEALKDKEDGLTGVPTGFTDLDRLTSGLQSSDLIILAARPGMGKTSFVLSLARNAAMDFNKGVAIFSLEMASTQLVQRLISLEAEISGSKLRSGKLEEYEWQQLHSTIEKMSEIPIYIDDTPGINIFELRAKCRRLKMQHDIQMVIIDYLQLMSGTSGNKNTNREQEISQISRALKGLAKELKVPVIALSQLSRAVEVRGGSKRPQLSDLRECLTGDTRVALVDGSYVPIKELLGSGAEVVAINVGDQKLTSQNADLVWETGVRPVFELTLASGRKIKATAEHRFLNFNGWKKLKDFEINDRIAIARKLPEPANPQHIPDERLILLAHLMGDGSYLKGQPLRYTTASELNSEIVTKAAVNQFGVKVNRHESKGNWHQLVFSGNGNRWHPAAINLWLRQLGVFDNRSCEKHFPREIFQLNNHQAALFLQHLWATDGTIFTPKKESRTAPRIAFSTNSRQLAEDVAHLLLRFEIVARIRKVNQGKHRPMFTVDVSGTRDQLVFLDKIGSFGEKRKDAAKLEAFLSGIVPNTNSDTVPKEIFDIVRARMKAKNVSQRKMATMRGTSYGGTSHFRFAPSRGVLENYAALLDDEELSKWANSDLFWDTVAEIKEVGEEMVYDMTVPIHQSFVANGVVSHNSGAIEQDADIVSFIYRPEYYQIMEDESGQSLKGIAEIIIAKHRNGALETIKLRFTDQFAKFSDLGDPNFDAFPSSDPFAAPFEPASVITRPSKMNDDEDIPF